MIESPLVIAGVIAMVTFLGFWLDRNVPALSKIGASLLVIIFGALLSNTGVLPLSSPVYSGVTGPVTLLAIAWLLLAVNLSDLKKAGPRMIGAFGIAVVGTALGAMIGGLVFAERFGDQAWRLGAVLTGTFSGGSLNFAAVDQWAQVDASILGGTVAADNVLTAVWLGATLMLPLWLKRFFPTPIPASATEVENQDGSSEPKHPFFDREPLSTLDLAALLAAGFVLVLLSEAIAGWWNGLGLFTIPSVLWLTTLALLAGHLTPLREARGAFQLGNLALHFFFVVIGIYSKISEILDAGVAVFFFVLLVVSVHGIVTYGLGRLFKMDLGTLSVASQAAVGGPSSALAVAVSREWRGLVLPGVIVGLLGYAVGTYAGIAVGALLRGLAGG